MSYNILADYLAQRHPELYNQGIYLKKNSRNFFKSNIFNQISVGIDWVHIEWNIRFQRILKELQQHKCDIICLQEVQGIYLIYNFKKFREIDFTKF